MYTTGGPLFSSTFCNIISISVKIL